LKNEAKGISLALLPILLISIGVFLSCVFGGYIVNDQTHLPAGLDVLFAEIFGGSDAPLLTHAVLGLPIVAALIWILFSRRIQQVPGQTFTAVWLLFFLFVGVSAIFSSFRSLSLTLWLEWLVYGAGVFAVVACVGRNRGPLAVLSALSAGSAVVALKGLMEYGQMRGTDASWRIFAGWVNPNATAALLLIGFFVSLGLCVTAERLPALLAGTAAVLVAFAIFLTGSKGGVSLGLPLGTIAFAVCLSRKTGGGIAALVAFALVLAGLIGVMFLKNVGWLGLALSALFAVGVVFLTGQPEIRKTNAMRIAGCYLAALALVLVLSISTASKASPPPTTPSSESAQSHTPAPAATPIARIAQGGGSQEQSATFRINLWKSALHLIKSRPVTGYGMGTYRYESARAGLSTSTLFAHNTILELWAECGLIATALFVAGIAIWFWTVLKNHTNLSAARQGPFAGVLAAVIALLAHSMVDSDLYYFGIGLAFFILLGIGLLLSVDSVAPEFVPKPVRTLSGLGLVAFLIAIFGAAHVDDMKARFRADLEAGAGGDLSGEVDSLKTVGQFDGDADYLVGRYLQATAATASEPLQFLQLAYRLTPSEKNARALANVQQQMGESASATATLQESLARDPNNLITLSTLMKFQEDAGDEAAATTTAQRLVDVESGPYFSVRSIPESVPTETFFARFNVLAPQEKNPKTKADILAAGVKGMLPYAQGTAQIIFHNSDQGKSPQLKMPGYDSLEEAASKLKETEKAAQEAGQIYGSLGDRAAAAEMETDGRLLAASLDAISPK
jgi:tetratricopeptide (TPR) repeat protein